MRTSHTSDSVAATKGHAWDRKSHSAIASTATAELNPALWVVTECYPRPTAPNSCAFTHRQLAAVREAGWAISVFVPNGWFPPILWRAAPAWRAAHQRALPNDWAQDGIPVRDLRVQNRVPSRLSSPRSHVQRVEVALGTAIDRAAAPPSIMLVEFALPYGGAVARAALARGIPYAVHLRGDDVWIWPHRSSEHMSEFRDVIREAALVIGVSSAIVREALHLSNVSGVSTAVVRNGVDLVAFKNRSAAERARVRTEFGVGENEVAVLCVASELEMKGWKDLLDAIGNLPNNGPRMRLYAAISGARSDMDVVGEARVRAPNVELRVYRDLPHARLADLYAATDIFALASRSEGLSNALLEAMASGLCSISTDVGGHSEVVENGINGLLVRPSDIGAFGAALQSVRVSPVQRMTLGSAARARMEQLGDTRQAGFALAEHFRTLLHDNVLRHAI